MSDVTLNAEKHPTPVDAPSPPTPMTSGRPQGHGQSLALHALVVAKLLRDPERVLEIARRNTERDLEIGDVHSEKYIRE